MRSNYNPRTSVKYADQDELFREYDASMGRHHDVKIYDSPREFYEATPNYGMYYHYNYPFLVGEVGNGESKGPDSQPASEPTEVSDYFTTLYWLNAFTALVHLCSFVAITILSSNSESSGNELRGDITVSATCWTLPNGSGQSTDGSQMPITFGNEPQAVWDRKEYLRVLVLAFFMLSFVFQSYHVVFPAKYKQLLQDNGVQVVRYCEYSLSASVMLVAICVNVFLSDFYTHVMVFVCSFLCMQLGLGADLARVGWYKAAASNVPPTEKQSNVLDDTKKGLRLLTFFLHSLGWLAILIPYCVFWVHYGITSNLNWDCLGHVKFLIESNEVGEGVEASVPWFVTLILFAQFFLFFSFGLVQLVQIMIQDYDLQHEEKFDPDTIEKRHRMQGYWTELSFVCLSLIAKSLLGWVIASQVLIAG